MATPVWFVELIKKAFPNRFAVARLTRWPLIGSLMQHWLAEGDDLIYLTRDHVISIYQTLDAPESMVLPSQVVDYFIDKASYHWIMNFCICREAEKCQNYPRDLGCLFLGEAASRINPKLGRHVSKEEALEHVRRCREAGLVHLIGRNKLDTVWLGVGPGDRLLTICNCCPCCCLWRVLPYVAPAIGEQVHRMPGVTVTVGEGCTGCGTCTQDVCFVDAIHLVEGRAVISDACRGCGRCVSICPEGAIRITISNEQLVDEIIQRISSVVDVT
ncbi:MAG: 4Fe-4S binding protein [Chloroflexi bacterium]|nr:4Fe-4S binding protein [Chloroflexota bacterium]